MSHALSREFETITKLIEYQYQTNEGIKWITIALLGTLEILDEYWDTVENVDEAERDPDYQGKVIDSIWETIHAWVVHNEIPMTEEERLAAEDQAVAELRDQLESVGKDVGVDSVRIRNLDELLGEIWKSKKDNSGDAAEERG